MTFARHGDDAVAVGSPTSIARELVERAPRRELLDEEEVGVFAGLVGELEGVEPGRAEAA